MQKLLITFLLIWWVKPVAFSQSFTFADTYPTSNLDSLERWLKTHPQPTEERLKNLIRLHRTWRYGYIEKIERYLPELKLLSYRINNPVGNAFYNLQSAYFRFKSGHHFADLEATQRALATFEALKDTSGTIHALADLVHFNFDSDGSEIGSQYFAKDYLNKIEVMLKHRSNVHDYFYAEYVKFKYYTSKHYTDYKALIASFHKTLALCESNPDYAYAWALINNVLSVLYNRDNQHDKSYQLESAILRKLKPEQTKERLRTLQNIMISCEGLKKYDELLEMAYRESKLLHECYDLGKPIDPIFHTNLHLTLKHEMTRRKRYKEALLYSDSLYYAQLILYDYRRKQNLNDLQAKFKTVENQKKITQIDASGTTNRKP